MVVVYNSDERFAGVFAVSVLSLFENNQNVDDIIVYLIENGISNESKKRFNAIAEQYGRKILTVPLLDLKKIIGVDLSIPKKYNLANYGRLFIASQLPNDIDKVIYADCDTMFEKSLLELWNTDISEYYIGMADDGFSTGYRKILGIPRDGIYYNSGIMLVNLKMWRETNVEEMFVEYIRQQGGYVPIIDQGVLNATLDGKILHLPLRFNAYSILYAFDYAEILRVRKPPYFYSEQEVEAARNAPVMVHFTNNFYMPIRPWVKGCVHPYAQKYLEYRDKTPWKNDPLWNDDRPKIKKLYTTYCHKVPKPMAIYTSRIIHVYLTPLMHRFNKWKHCMKQKIKCNSLLK